MKIKKSEKVGDALENKSNFKKRTTIDISMVDSGDNKKTFKRPFMSVRLSELKNKSVEYTGVAYVLSSYSFRANYVEHQLHNVLASREAKEYEADTDLETFVSEYAKKYNFSNFGEELLYVRVKGSAIAKPGKSLYDIYLGGEYAIYPEYNDVYINLREAQQLVEAYDCEIKVSHYLKVKGKPIGKQTLDALKRLPAESDYYIQLEKEIESRDTPLATLSFRSGLSYCIAHIAADLDKECGLITAYQHGEFLVNDVPYAGYCEKSKSVELRILLEAPSFGWFDAALRTSRKLYYGKIVA